MYNSKYTNKCLVLLNKGKFWKLNYEPTKKRKHKPRRQRSKFSEQECKMLHSSE